MTAKALRKNLEYIDLFASSNGLSTGLFLAGWSGQFAVGRNEAAYPTLKANLIENRIHFACLFWMPAWQWDLQSRLKDYAPNPAGRGMPLRDGTSAAISDLRRIHGTIPDPDTRGFKSGITSRPHTDLQRRVRARSSPQIVHTKLTAAREDGGIFGKISPQ